MRRGLALVTAGAIVAGGAAGCEVGSLFETKRYTGNAQASVESSVLTPEQSARISNTYERLQKYWQGSMTAQLVVLQGQDETVCTRQPNGDQYMTRATEGAKYCFNTDKIIMTGGFVASTGVRLAENNADMDAVITVATAHEGGHAVQAHSSAGRVGLNAASGTPEHLQSEHGADYYAGEFMCGDGGYSLTEITNVKKVLSRLGSDDADHGPAGDRVGAFNSGLAAAGCNPYAA